MFWDIFISWWYMLYVLALVFRGVGTAYLSESDDLVMRVLCGSVIWGCATISFFLFRIIPWWAALLSFPMGLIIAFVVRLILMPLLLPLSSSRVVSYVFSVLSVILMFGSLYLASMLCLN